jgi:hypothetical protein
MNCLLGHCARTVHHKPRFPLCCCTRQCEQLRPRHADADEQALAERHDVRSCAPTPRHNLPFSSPRSRSQDSTSKPDISSTGSGVGASRRAGFFWSRPTWSQPPVPVSEAPVSLPAAVSLEHHTFINALAVERHAFAPAASRSHQLCQPASAYQPAFACLPLLAGRPHACSTALTPSESLNTTTLAPSSPNSPHRARTHPTQPLALSPYRLPQLGRDRMRC